MLSKPKEKIFDLEINGVSLRVRDFEGSSTPVIVSSELRKDRYGIESIDFSYGDIVLDIGAHVGIVSLYLGKKFPFLKIYAFEPIPDNYGHFKENIKINEVTNVNAYNLAITSDGRDLPMIVNFFDNSGGGTGHLSNMRLPGHFYFTVPSITLKQVFEKHKIEKCKLLKIDCEGSEHEILGDPTTLSRVEYLSGEFHINQHLRKKGYSTESLIKRCLEFIAPSKLKIKTIKMAE